MVITLNGNEYNLFFSIAGIDYLDNAYYIDAQGIKFGFGVGLLSQQLAVSNPVGIFRAIKAGLFNKTVKDEWIEQFVTEKAEKDELESLAKELYEELKKQPLTRKTVMSLAEKPIEKN